jgi:hypothetical protein
MNIYSPADRRLGFERAYPPPNEVGMECDKIQETRPFIIRLGVFGKFVWYS